MNRLDELLLLWQDQSIDENELIELKKLLATREGRDQIAEHFFLTGVVLETLQTQKAANELASIAEELPSADKQRPPSRYRFSFRLAGAAALLLTALGAVLWFGQPPSPPSLPPASASVFAQFEQVQGDTFVVSNTIKQIAQAGQVLIPGQGIATEGADSEAVVQMKDDVRLKLGGDTIVVTTEVEEPNAGGPRIVLEQGDLLVEVNRSLRRKKMTVQTPLGVAVTETEDTALHVSDAAGIAVVRGAVHFVHKGTGKAIRLQGGHYLAITPEGELYAAQLFSGNGTVWTTFPRAGLDTTWVAYQAMFSPDGKLLAAASRYSEAGVRVGNLETPGLLRGERCLGFSPDGKLLATADKSDILLYALPGGESPRVLAAKDRRGRAVCLAFSPDGKSLAVGKGGPKDAGEVDLWDTATGTLRTTWRGHSAAVTTLAFSPDSKCLASGSLDRTVLLWDVVADREQTRIPESSSHVVWSLAFAPNGKTLALASGPVDFRLAQPGEVRLWDVEAARVRTRLQGHTRGVTSVIFAADGQTAITGSADTTVRFWDPARGRQYGMLKGHKAAPGFEALSVALAPDGSHLATASFDRTVKLWKTTWNKKDSQVQAFENILPPLRTGWVRPTLAYLAPTAVLETSLLTK